MVNDFQIARIPNIHFGIGKLMMLPSLLFRYDGEALIVISESLAVHSSQIVHIKSAISNSGLNVSYIYIKGEPSAILVDELVNSYRNRNIGVVCAIGGGSVIDTSKAISAMLYEEDSVELYLEGIGSKTVSGKRVPLIAIPSTAGTGSEATKNAVIGKIGMQGYKHSLRHDNYVPDIAIIDPTLSLSCSSSVTAASGMDAFTQLLESFLSTKSNSFTDALAFTGLKAIKDSLLAVYSDGTNLKARTDLALAAMVSGITLANAGLGLVHGFASSLGGFFEIPHGVICGTLLAEVFKAHICVLIEQEHNEALIEKFVLLAKLFLPESDLTKIELLMNFSDLLYKWTNILQIPRLGDYGVKASDAQNIINITEFKNNPLILPESVLMKILLNRI